MMATVPHVTSGLGLRKFQADGFLLIRVYPLNRSLGGTESPDARVLDNKISYPCQEIEMQFFGPPTRSFVTTPTVLSWLLIFLQLTRIAPP